LATRRRGERRAMVLLAYSLFAWAALYEIKVTNVSPDMIVAGATFAVATLSLRSSAPRLSARREVAFGVALAVGCLAKAAFLPVAVVWLVSRMLLGQRTRAQRLAGIAIAGATLATLIVPYFATLSVKEGHLTTGASGGIDRVPEFLNWHPSNDDFGFPRHPTDELSSEPPAYSYTVPVAGRAHVLPVAGSIPVWYDPSYWFAGVQPRFELGGQIRVLVTNLSVYAKILFASPLILALLLLGGPSAYARRVGRFPEVAVSLRMRLTRPGATLFVAPTAALFIYGVVHVLPRYVAPFVCVTVLGLAFARRAGGDGSKPLAAVTAAVTTSVGIGVLALSFAPSVYHVLRQVALGQPPPGQADVIAAEQLHQLGEHDGGQLVYVGAPSNVLDAYWARLSGSRVVANVVQVGPWSTEDNRRVKRALYAVTARTDASFAVTDQSPPPRAGWRALGSSGYWALPLT